MKRPGNSAFPGIKGKIPTIYYGLRAIAQRFGVGMGTIMNWYIKDSLPMVRRPCAKKYSRIGWTWYLDETLIGAWQGTKHERERKQYLATAAARRLTVRERCIRKGRPIPDEHKLPQDK